MKRNAENRVTEFEVGDVLDIRGKRYIVGGSTANRLNNDMKDMRLEPSRKKDLLALDESLRRSDDQGKFDMLEEKIIFQYYPPAKG